MTEHGTIPADWSPTEQDMKEFDEKFHEFYESLPDKEQAQAASVVVFAVEEVASQEGTSETPQVEGQDMEPPSEEELKAFMAKLDSFHDSLPEGQHQILDLLTAKAIEHSVPEEERDDVQGHGWWVGGLTQSFATNSSSFSYFNTYAQKCYNERGIFKYRNITWDGRINFGCWDWT